MTVENVSMLHGTLLWMAGGSNENISEEINQHVCDKGWATRSQNSEITHSILTRQSSTEKKGHIF